VPFLQATGFQPVQPNNVSTKESYQGKSSHIGYFAFASASFFFFFSSAAFFFSSVAFFFSSVAFFLSSSSSFFPVTLFLIEFQPLEILSVRASLKSSSVSCNPESTRDVSLSNAPHSLKLMRQPSRRINKRDFR